MGRSENAIHALQHRGRRRLRTELERLQAAPVALAA
jgi:DNA-directed RNA polymerase specialized sigma24 family protein